MTSITRPPSVQSTRAPAAKAVDVPPLAGLKPTPPLQVGVDFSKPRPISEQFAYPVFGATLSISFSPFDDVGAVHTAGAILIVRPSTGAIVSTVPSYSAAEVRVKFSPSRIDITQYLGNESLESVHDAVSGMVDPSPPFKFTDWRQIKEPAHLLSQDRTSVLPADALPREHRRGRIAAEGAKTASAIELKADETETGGFVGATVSPSGNRVMVDAVYPRNTYVKIFDGEGNPLVRVRGSFVGFLPEGDHFMVSTGRGDDHAFVIHDGVTSEVLSTLPSPGFDVGEDNTFRFRGESQIYEAPSYRSRPRFRIDVDASGETIALSGRIKDVASDGVVQAWKFPRSEADGAAVDARTVGESSFEASPAVNATLDYVGKVDGVLLDAQRKLGQRARDLGVIVGNES